MKIQFSKVTIGKEEKEAVNRVLSSGWLASGLETEAFEKEFAHYISEKSDDGIIEVTTYAIFTNSCTSALKMAYKYYYEMGYRKYYLHKPNTFCATYSAAEEMGLKRTYKIDNKTIPIAMHYGGVFQSKHCLIEDSAHRIEANDPLIGKIRCYSFYATKNLTTGSGGMFVTADKDIYEKARLYWKDGLSTSTYDRQHGKGWNYKVEAMSGGYDGNDIAAAIGREQLRKLPEFTKKRNEIRDRYNEAFGQEWTGNHLYEYFVNNKQEVFDLIDCLQKAGIGCGYHYPPLREDWLGVSLPIYPLLKVREQDYVVSTIREFENNRKCIR